MELAETLARHERLKASETIAERVLEDKNLILEYQKKMAENREVLGKWRRKNVTELEAEKSYLYLGGFFVKLPQHKVREIVKKDQERLKNWENATRKRMKEGISQLQKIIPSERPAAVVDLLLKETKSP
mmetsp:Transcript_19922/g.27779  ORF Transcript_19922/g.27779 Transcript_19922/m.27779 type:complete len:129 (+) Transcript_19922:1-387(+)